MKFFFSLCICIAMFSTTSIKASEYDDYEYTSSKQDNGLTYELTKVDLTTSFLYLEGWAYIPDSQHYTSASDIKITIMSYESGGNKTYYETTITNDYDLTMIEKYNGVDYCEENIYNQSPDDCAYYYKYVGFEVKIPISEFIYPNTYEFYIYVEAKDSHIKRYTKLYSPNVEDSVTIGNYDYKFNSDIEDTELIVNDPHVFVRTTPEKNNSNYYVEDNCTYYWTENEEYHSSSKEYNYPVTWYNMGFNATNDQGYGGCLAKDGTNNYGYIASNFVDFQGYGNSTLIIESTLDSSIDKVAIPTINSSDDIIITVDIKTENLNVATNIELFLQYGSYSNYYSLYIDEPIETVEIVIDDSHYQKGTKISLEIVGSDFDNSNNKVIISPVYSSTTPVNVSLSSGQNFISLTVVSGFEYKEGETTKYYETFGIEIEAPIDSIQEELNGFNSNFDNFYAGGSFSYNFSIEYSNNYPYNYINNQQIKPYMSISNSYTDNGEEIIYYIKENGEYKLPYVYIDENNNVSYEKSESDIYNDGKNVIYTDFHLENGKYPFSITINDLGVNELNLVINSYFEVSGILFSHSDDTLLYYRTMSPINPMPEYKSAMWENYNINTIFDDIYSESIDIYLTTDAKKEIKTWIEKDYQNNINSNNEEFKTLVNELINNKDIIISEAQ